MGENPAEEKFGAFATWIVEEFLGWNHFHDLAAIHEYHMVCHRARKPIITYWILHYCELTEVTVLQNKFLLLTENKTFQLPLTNYVTDKPASEARRGNELSFGTKLGFPTFSD